MLFYYLKKIKMSTNSKEYNKKNYKKYRWNPKAIKDRVTRNAARRKAEREGKVKKGDWKEVDHIGWIKQVNPNAPKNLRVIARKTNRKLWAQKANRNKNG